MSLHIRSLAAALIFVLLAGGAAHARPLSGPPLSARGGFLDAAWSWVVSLFPLPLPAGRSTLSKGFSGSEAEGMMDPNGSTTEAARHKSETSEEGGMMDPNGLR
jgi:hypothetical protein